MGIVKTSDRQSPANEETKNANHRNQWSNLEDSNLHRSMRKNDHSMGFKGWRQLQVRRLQGFSIANRKRMDTSKQQGLDWMDASEKINRFLKDECEIHGDARDLLLLLRAMHLKSLRRIVMAGFDERCPHCNAKIDCNARWSSSDHSTEFHVDCECGKRVCVNVHMVPEFETSKVMCQICHRAEASMWYCEPCHEKLRKERKVLTV